MKYAVYRRRAAVVFGAALILSCAAGPQTARDTGPAVSSAAPPAESRPADPVLKNLPAEARTYLERLSRAFASRDEPFLLAQGEPQFEAEVRPRHDAETYLALLYRIGPYAADSPRPAVRPPRLNPAGVSRIEYLSWEENGPLLEINARLIGADGAATPCLIMLVWRLREPKIEGFFP